MADIVLPSLVLNDDDGPGIDDDHSVSDGEAGDLAEVEDEGEVGVALPDDLSAVVQQVENLHVWSEAERIADRAEAGEGAEENREAEGAEENHVGQGAEDQNAADQAIQGQEAVLPRMQVTSLSSVGLLHVSSSTLSSLSTVCFFFHVHRLPRVQGQRPLANIASSP